MSEIFGNFHSVSTCFSFVLSGRGKISFKKIEIGTHFKVRDGQTSCGNLALFGGSLNKAKANEPLLVPLFKGANFYHVQ